ncbi:MAG: glutathione S-transferase N-terminal domain-containing protein [Halobacteriovoraceae bacterium]|nr:glutathione S-transferase N-terminal domain-containing protein [Halobacteriovoraceae bacterium]
MEKIQLYSLATPNGQKVSIALEEMKIPYKAYTIDINSGYQFEEKFIKINPNSKIPAIIDPIGDDGKPLAIMESGAILVYLAEKSGKFFPKDPALRCKTLQWLFFQVSGPGPMFGQFGHFFRFAKDKCEHPYPLERYKNEAKRLLGVIDIQLSKFSYIVCDRPTIADFALFPWILCLDKFYEAREILELDSFTNITKWVGDLAQRPAVQKGLNVCSL